MWVCVWQGDHIEKRQCARPIMPSAVGATQIKLPHRLWSPTNDAPGGEGKRSDVIKSVYREEKKMLARKKCKKKRVNERR